MKRILIKSTLISLIITLTGFLINMISYLTRGSLVFCRTLYGGEWIGYYGFGLLINHTFPMTAAGDPAASGSTWLTFDPGGLLTAFVIAFLTVSAVLLIRYRLLKYPED